MVGEGGAVLAACSGWVGRVNVWLLCQWRRERKRRKRRDITMDADMRVLLRLSREELKVRYDVIDAFIEVGLVSGDMTGKSSQAMEACQVSFTDNSIEYFTF